VAPRLVALPMAALARAFARLIGKIAPEGELAIRLTDMPAWFPPQQQQPTSPH
jgi:hypothetical protein